MAGQLQTSFEYALFLGSIYATVLATMDGEEYRTGSADSENGSDNSYVQVTQEEAQQLGSQEQPPAAPQSEPYTAKIPAGEDEEDIYGADPDEGTPTREEQVKHQQCLFSSLRFHTHRHPDVHQTKLDWLRTLAAIPEEFGKLAINHV